MFETLAATSVFFHDILLTGRGHFLLAIDKIKFETSSGTRTNVSYSLAILCH